MCPLFLMFTVPGILPSSRFPVLLYSGGVRYTKWLRCCLSLCSLCLFVEELEDA